MWPVLKSSSVATTRPAAPHRRFLPIPRPEEHLEGREPAPRGLYPGEPEACRRDVRQFGAVLLHLGLLVALFHVYRLEGRAFQILVALAAGALPIHYLLPYRWKKPFFIAASIVGMTWVFGPSVALVVLPIAAALIGACYLPLSWRSRALVIAAAAVILGVGRGGLAGTFVPEAAWMVLGTMFMFRMIVLMYELKHAKAPERPVDVLGYFFLLPNYCFPHFPVVDYRTLQRGYFATDIHVIQRGGLRMMFRGAVQLLLYRLVYHLLLIPADEVHDFGSLVGFLVCNYLLYLRVSGQFHMACGMLHLFGHQLPETHHHYLLATGFTDYWRRINIYWKDFMVRVVFNPVVFRLKKRPQALALSVATVAVFLTTWALHAYQSFWLRGHWGFSVPDALFWGILGALVLVNVRNDARSQRTRARLSKGKSRPSPRELAIRAIKILGTFTTIALLWSLWSSPSVGAWLAMLGRGLSLD